MEMVKVKIIGQAITQRYGVLNTGDIVQTDAEFARHLVDDCAAAEYCNANASLPTPDEEKDLAEEDGKVVKADSRLFVDEPKRPKKADAPKTEKTTKFVGNPQ